MNELTRFRVTLGALSAVASVLGRHPGMQPALVMKPSFEVLDDRGLPETSFGFESFWIVHDVQEKFSQWPKVDLCGEAVPVEPRALKRLNGRTLTLETREVVIAGEKETLEFYVAA